MIAHPWRQTRYLAFVLAVALAGFVGVMGTQSASAAPAGAAQSLSVYDQDCLSNGQVQAVFVWVPSGQGTQWFDITRDPTFTRFGNEGPFPASGYFTDWTLEPNTRYYVRVTTFTSVGPRVSDILSFTTLPCAGAFTPPHSIDADVFDDYVNVSWQRGTGNLFFCVDTAFTQSDLVEVEGSWHNWGCGTTGESLNLTDLACGRQHYFRIWAAGNGTSGYSGIGSFVSQDCDFSPPSNPDADVRSDGSVRITWTKGANNAFSCIDLAKSQQDLLDFDDTWFNAACGTTGNSAILTNLSCGTSTWCRIWATSFGQAGYSGVESFTTLACDDFDPPTGLEADITGGGDDVTFSWDPSDPAADYYCVDYANSQSHLTNFGDSWDNFCVNGPVTQATVEDLAEERAGETVYWRVFAFSRGMTGYSEIETIDLPGLP